ncbi:MAG: VCBS repeat-containing protein [Planctomycetota bacterium]
MTPIGANGFNREWDLEAADLDGDGDLDLAATGFNNFQTHFFENLGGGAFAPQISLGTGTGEHGDLALVDVDLDGDLDVIQGRSRTEAPRPLTAAPSNPVGPIYARDVDGDGDTDVLYLNPERTEVIALVQTSPGQFAPPASVGVGPGPILEVVVTDLDADGNPDLVLAAGFPGAASIGWLAGLGAGSFDFYALLRDDSEVLGLIAQDIDADGFVDLSWFRPSPRILVRARGIGGGSIGFVEIVGQLGLRPEAVIEGPAGPGALQRRSSTRYDGRRRAKGRIDRPRDPVERVGELWWAGRP